MSIPSAWPQVLDFFGTPLVIEPSAGQLSGDAGLLPVRPFDQRIGLTQAFADALDDPRDPMRTPRHRTVRPPPRLRPPRRRLLLRLRRARPRRLPAAQARRRVGQPG